MGMKSQNVAGIMATSEMENTKTKERIKQRKLDMIVTSQKKIWLRNSGSSRDLIGAYGYHCKSPVDHLPPKDQSTFSVIQSFFNGISTSNGAAC
mmetsp:Transcript_2690/g.5564  ORF Transcript_2690/g.5564 Transcript_2690/m.5564 type:complete len:94 (-) Transcript_2690:8-289(-)